MPLTLNRIIQKNVWFHRRSHLATACGVAAATAVIVGALIVGDSVRGSLREMTLDRLGRIDEVFVAERFVSPAIIQQLHDSKTYRTQFGTAEGVVFLPAVTAESSPADSGAGVATFRVNQVSLIGCAPSFWKLGNPPHPTDVQPGEREIVLNEPLAEELGVRVGGEVTLRLPKISQVPSDSPLAHKTDRISGLVGLKVVAVIPASGLGQFRLHPSQESPRNAFVSLSTLQEALGVPDRINVVLIPGIDPATVPDAAASSILAKSIRPRLEDLGVRVKHVRAEYSPPGEKEPRSAFEYFSVTTDRMVFAPEASAAILETVANSGGQPVLTYLANRIEVVRDSRKEAATEATTATTAPSSGASSKAEGTPRESLPYSMVSAIDPGETFPIHDLNQQPIKQLGEHEIVLNSWAAEQLGVQVGDTIRLTYFDPETTHGQTQEHTADFTLKAITPITRPTNPYRSQASARFESAPERANDPDLTPEVAGVTDQDSMDNWDAPFPFDYSLVKKPDDIYWDEYRTTPKAFVSLSAGRRLWGSRFGDTTSIRVPTAQRSLEQFQTQLADSLRGSPEKFGLTFLPIKRQQLAASSGSTPFDVLFLSLSFFVIASALLLVGILYRLGVDRRAVEMGVMSAVGLSARDRFRILLTEGGLVSIVGSAVGILAGVGYAWLMLAGLRTWWVGAISTPFLQFHARWLSLILGFVIGVVASLITIYLAVRQLNRVSAIQLISGQTNARRTWAEDRSRQSSRKHAIARWLYGTPAVAGLLVVAMGLAVVATQSGGMSQSLSFVGAGALILVAELLGLHRLLSGESRSGDANARISLQWLGVQNNRRNVTRTTTTIAMVAVACFLIVALSSFRLAPTEEGTGGFHLVAQSSEPLFADLNDPAARKDLFGDQAAKLEGTRIFSLRMHAGDDASCNNLYQASQPRVLGVTEALIEHFDHSLVHFRFAASDAGRSGPESERANPWHVLSREPSNSGPDEATIPVVLDKNTAMYSLHLYRGIGETFDISYEGRPPIRFRVVGLLENSILQGSLLISEANLVKLFPENSGYRYFLVQVPKVPAEQASGVTALLEGRFSDEGFDTTSADAMLERFLTVQNTYLSTFQSLGALGLFLGTFGLAAIQLRNVWERRRELAVMRATGFRPRRLMLLLIWENLYLLGAGLICGLVAALLAVLPHKFLGDGSIPLTLLRDLAVMLGIVLIVGFATSTWASRSVLRAPLLSSLRGD